MTTATLFAAPDFFAKAEPQDVMLPRSLMEDVSTEVGNQLLRKFMASFGSNLALADGVALYAGQINTGRSIYAVTHNKDGSPNNSPVKFGFVFESQVTGEQNRSAVIHNTGKTYARTDDLYLDTYRDGSPLPHKDLESVACYNNEYTDVVGYSENGICVKQQLKVVKNTEVLLEERYTLSEDPQAPDEIVVSADDYERHKTNLERYAQSHNPELSAKARAALQKLRPSTTTRAQTENGAAYRYVVRQIVTDAACRAGERTLKGLLAEVGMLVVGGAVWELREAAKNPHSLSIGQHFERFWGVIWGKLISSAVVRVGKEFGLEALKLLMGALRSIFKSAGVLLSAIGQGLNTVWESVYGYLTGKISSFSQLVSIILKSLTTVGIGTLAYMLEQQLTALGIPNILGGLLATALAAVAIVFANRTIDASIYVLVNLFSGAEASKIRLERIEELCREAIPRLSAERENLERTIQSYYQERKTLFNAVFHDFKSALSSRDTVKTFMALETLNQAFGCTLGWKTEEEFDEMMERDAVFVL